MLTFAPDDVHDKNSILHSIRFQGYDKFPAKVPATFDTHLHAGEDFSADGVDVVMSEAALQIRAATSPVAVTLGFRQIVRGITEGLLGLPDMRRLKNSPTVNVNNILSITSAAPAMNAAIHF